MGRQISYNPEEVLSKAVHVFWEKGYESTSVKDLVKATGVKPGSLYLLYKNKQELFHASLEAYSTQYLEKVKAIFKEKDDPVLAVETFLREVVMVNITNEKTKGCLLVKTQVSVHQNDVKIQSYINHYFSEVEKLIRAAIEDAKQKGLTTVDPEHFASFVVTTIFGAHSYYQANQDSQLLEKNINYLLSVLHKGRAS